jgi:hypothetical protein
MLSCLHSIERTMVCQSALDRLIGISPFAGFDLLGLNRLRKKQLLCSRAKNISSGYFCLNGFYIYENYVPIPSLTTPLPLQP